MLLLGDGRRRLGGIGASDQRRRVIGWKREPAALTVIAKFMHEAFNDRGLRGDAGLARKVDACGARPSPRVDR
jgi:hypothetical protein